MKGIKKTIDHYLKANASNQIHFVMSKKQKCHHVVVVPRKNLIRLNEEFVYNHKNDIAKILNASLALLQQTNKTIIYHKIEEL